MHAMRRSQRPRSGATNARAARRLLLPLLTGLFLLGDVALVDAQTTASAVAETGAPFTTFVTEASQRFGIPAAWIRALMRVESANDIRAISPKGAQGLMQIMPDTWAYLRTRYRLGVDPFDPHDNILAGTAYMRELYDRYGSPGFLAAYNAGPGRYEEYRDRGRTLPAETRAYVDMLVPLIGTADMPTPITVAAADPLDWTHAPLFIVQAEGSSAADRPQLDGASATPSAPPLERAPEPTDPQSGDLFIVRPSPVRPR